ncbi:hypothetical protein [Brachyspira sp.]|uniref:hypothetical protein n=1 Tax=Brachyspira sp. TaxID=1977261 RepID=UPI003D7D2E49
MNGLELEERRKKSLGRRNSNGNCFSCCYRVDESGFDLAITCATSNLRIETKRGKKIKLP